MRLQKLVVHLSAAWAAICVRVLFANALVRLIPYGILGNVRTRILRWAGYRNIATNVWFHGAPTLRGPADRTMLRIGPKTSVNTPCIWDLNGEIRIGTRVGIGPYSTIITGSHEIGPPEERRGERTTAGVHIGDGVWIGACVTILPGVTIGNGAVVAAGALVRRSVAPNTLVGGVPARVLRQLDDAPASGVVSRARLVPIPGTSKKASSQ